jgi:molybdenum cofactor guanylyltransferase
MGFDKTRVVVDGSTIAARTGEILKSVVERAVEVGPGVSELPSTLEDPPGSGPLAAVAAGWDLLRGEGFTHALVVAGDLPFLTDALLELLIEWPSAGSVVPVVRGRDQPLCARWSREDLDDARGLLERGERSLAHLAGRPDVDYLDEGAWGSVATERQFADVDTSEDLERWGLEAPDAHSGE